MPYRRKYLRKPKRKNLSKPQARAVKSLALKVIKSNSEWKHYTLNSTYAAGTSAAVGDLTAVPQGDTDTTRDGDQLMASSLNVRFSLVNADASNLFRVIFFQWFPATTPDPSDILNTTANYEVQAMYQTDSAPQFKIMYDKTFALNANFSGHQTQLYKSMKLRVPRPKMQFTAGGTTGTNKVYYLAVSDSGVVSHPSITLVAKLNFRDA